MTVQKAPRHTILQAETDLAAVRRVVSSPSEPPEQRRNLHAGIGRHVPGRARGVTDLIVGQQAALDDLVLLTPLEERLGADRVVVEGELGLAGLGAANEIAVHVPLAEARERDVVLGRPPGEAAGLDSVIVVSFFRAGGLEVEEELVERFLPGKGGGRG